MVSEGEFNALKRKVDELSHLIDQLLEFRTLGFNEDYYGMVMNVTVDENTQGFGNLLHVDSDGHFVDAHADVEATMPCHGIALESGTGSKKIMFYGLIRDDDWNWTPGDLLWVDEDASGDVVDTANRPDAAGEFVQCVGLAISADVMFFNPQYEYIKLK